MVRRLSAATRRLHGIECADHFLLLRSPPQHVQRKRGHHRVFVSHRTMPRFADRLPNLCSSRGERPVVRLSSGVCLKRRKLLFPPIVWFLSITNMRMAYDNLVRTRGREFWVSSRQRRLKIWPAGVSGLHIFFFTSPSSFRPSSFGASWGRPITRPSSLPRCVLFHIAFHLLLLLHRYSHGPFRWRI